MSYIIAGDIGATKALLEVYDYQEGVVLSQQRYPSEEFDSLEQLVQLFMEDAKITSCDWACFGLPGPVVGRRSKLTNLSWQVDATQVEHSCSIRTVSLVNDFYAAAVGLEAVDESDLLTLHKGIDLPEGNRLLVGAGTGLGVSPICYCHGKYYPQASEGGHIDFGPLDALQSELLNWLRNKWVHVSYERMLSGIGLETLYAFFSIRHHGHNRRLTKLKAPEIEAAALQGDVAAQETLMSFIKLYGAFIGSVALVWPAKGGIYIAGGIAPKIRQWMQKPEFVEAFLNKGRMTPVVEEMSIRLVMNDQLGLLGARKLAMDVAKI